MAIKFLNEVFEEIDNRGIITLPEDGVCGDEYESWLCSNEIKEIPKAYSEYMHNTEKSVKWICKFHSKNTKVKYRSQEVSAYNDMHQAVM